MKRKAKTKINPYLKVFAQMERKLEKAYKKMREHMLKNASLEILQKDTHELMLLLGETNYLAKECKKFESKI